MTSIEWTDTTWNPTRGCRRVSEECTHCYAEADAHRRNLMSQGLNRPPPYEGLVRIGLQGEPRWTGEGRFVPDKLREPLSWRKPRRVFVDSMSDLFFEAFSFEQIAAVFGVMAACPRHTFQVLTKRPERAREWFAWLADRHKRSNIIGDSGGETIFCAWQADLATGHAAADLGLDVRRDKSDPLCFDAVAWPLPNVWLGVSCGIRSALPRLDVLRSIPASRRFVSFEPLLEDLGEDVDLHGIDWAIIGGESGKGARPFHLGWARALIAAARFHRTAVFVKQLGARAYPSPNGVYVGLDGVDRTAERAHPIRDAMRFRDPKGSDPSEWPADLRIREFPTEARSAAE